MITVPLQAPSLLPPPTPIDDYQDLHDDIHSTQALYKAFTADGQPIFWESNPHTGHKFWDLDCHCQDCLYPDDFSSSTLPKRKSRSKKKKDPL